MIIVAALSITTTLVTPNAATAASQMILMTAVSPKRMLAVSQTTLTTASSGTIAALQKAGTHTVMAPNAILVTRSQELGKINLTLTPNT
jgi:hypothetical protein